ncbi:MAG: DUF2796 domain-containing protein [Proteobacteria bacterium]|nr:DUF2796 domain-containing protein [Pseudomonadota bacterium]
MRKIIVTLVLGILSIYSLHVFSGSESEHHHTAHVHGEALLNLAIDKNTVLIEFESPAMNIIGFEHEPRTEEQINITKETNERLKNYNSVLTIPGSQCKQTDSTLEFAHDVDDEEEHHHDDHHEHEEVHSDYHLQYTVSCESLADLKIHINLFKHFPGIEHLDLNWINEQKQGKLELTSENNIIEF